MKIEDAIWLLAHSTTPEDRREWAVLYWKSQGLKHEEIAEKWGYSIQWVQRYMTRAYKRFEVPPQLNKYEKILYLEENVFPLMRKFIANEPNTVKELPAPPTESVPYEEPEQNDETYEKEKISEEPPIIEIIAPKRLPPPKDPWKTIRQLFFAGVSLLIISMVGFYAYNLGRGNTPAPQTVVITATFPPAADTALPTLTSVIPIDTAFPTASPTQVPTDTPIPTEFVPPADGILFQDTFDSEIGPDWTQVSGQWLVSNGRLTKIIDNSVSSYQWIVLKKDEWKNYILSIDVIQPYGVNSVVAVRNNTSNADLIGFDISSGYNDIDLVFIGNWMNENTLIAGDTSFPIPVEANVNIQLEVQGNTYILSSGGREVKRITIAGYDSGGISLGTYCTSQSAGCISFDNIKVTYLP